MPKYRKKPVVIEAIQFTGDNHEEIGRFAGFDAMLIGREKRLEIRTLEGNLAVSPGDYVIRGAQGEHYPIKEHIFLETYERVEE